MPKLGFSKNPCAPVDGRLLPHKGLTEQGQIIGINCPRGLICAPVDGRLLPNKGLTEQGQIIGINCPRGLITVLEDRADNFSNTES
jgi:hypothetical protein